MSYTRNTWVTGDVITAEKMNNIESGIETLFNSLGETESEIEEIAELIGGDE